MISNSPTEPAFDRLLQVAVEVFAHDGFRDATVRDICAKANVNVASVNYYFRSKEALYAQALAFAFQEANRLHPQDAAQDQNLPPEQRLGLFITHFLGKLLDDSQLGFHSKLIAREIAEPTKALDDIIQTAIVPQFALLTDIIQKILNRPDNSLLVRRCLLSIFSQCLMFKHSRAVIDRLYPELIADEAAIAASAEHITQFSLAALKGLA
ncbi:MAG: CerR family C-terminal domain-containing protein [Methylococcales bacterium]|nr:CerR family C-terminal domain-containing protein [Methylococcales bacterium]